MNSLEHIEVRTPVSPLLRLGLAGPWPGICGIADSLSGVHARVDVFDLAAPRPDWVEVTDAGRLG